jgi:ubiquinone biosynthesis protein UbiJ
MMEDAFWDLAMHDLAIRDLHDVVQRLQHEVQVLEERVQRLESGRYAFMECSER